MNLLFSRSVLRTLYPTDFTGDCQEFGPIAANTLLQQRMPTDLCQPPPWTDENSGAI